MTTEELTPQKIKKIKVQRWVNRAIFILGMAVIIAAIVLLVYKPPSTQTIAVAEEDVFCAGSCNLSVSYYKTMTDLVTGTVTVPQGTWLVGDWITIYYRSNGQLSTEKAHNKRWAALLLLVGGVMCLISLNNFINFPGVFNVVNASAVFFFTKALIW